MSRLDLLLLIVAPAAIAACSREAPSPPDVVAPVARPPQDAAASTPVSRFLGDPAAQLDCLAVLDAGRSYAADGETTIREHLCGVCPDVPRLDAPPLAPQEKSDVGDLEAWRHRLAPLFGEPSRRMKAAAERERDEVGAWLLPAQVLPAPEVALRDQVRSPSIEALKRDARATLRTIFRPPWLDERGAAELLALRGAVAGEDALLGGWAIAGRWFQVVVTRTDLFVRTTMTGSCGDEPREKVAEALAIATTVFDIPATPCCATWVIERYGSLASGGMAYFTHAHDLKSWSSSLAIVTDGKAIKYRFSRLTRRDAEPPPAPWFGREGAR